MSATLMEQVAAGKAPPLLPITVEQYHQMIRTGILREGAPIELIDGLLVCKDRSKQGADTMSHDPRHATSIKLLGRLDRRLEPLGFHAQIQLPVTLSETNEPEPDTAVVKGSLQDYTSRHPGPADIVAAIEVSDSSLRFDRTTKLEKYARAGIPQYWIVNLPDNQVEVYEVPLTKEGRYEQLTVYRPGQTMRLTLTATSALEIGVAEVLPQ